MNQEKMEPLNGKVSRESPKQDGPSSRDAVSQPTQGLALPLVPAAFPRTVGRVQADVSRFWAKCGIFWIHVFFMCYWCVR